MRSNLLVVVEGQCNQVVGVGCRGGTRSGKGYQLRSDHLRTVADMAEKGGLSSH